MSKRPIQLEKAKAAIEAFLDALGVPISDDPELKDTGQRVAEAYAYDLLAGYDMDPAQILAECTQSSAPGLVTITGIATALVCPHHLLPATGVVHVGYLPDPRVAGLGAIGKLVDCFARRLVLQEDLCQQIADALLHHLGAKGAACMATLNPTCVTARGERRHGAQATSLAWAGAFQTDGAQKAAFLTSIHSAHP